MKRSVVVGRTNVGKTLFTVHFAQYVGVRDSVWLLEKADGRTEQQRLSAADAKRLLSSPGSHHTRGLQSVCLDFARGKGVRQLLLTDTTGLTDGIHAHLEMREAMAQTLRVIMTAQAILHVVDASRIRPADDSREQDMNGWSALDDQLATFGQRHPGYILLANKMDLPAAITGYRELCRRWSKHCVVPISALYGSGFREVKQHVWKLA